MTGELQLLLTLSPAGSPRPLQRLVKSHHFDIDSNYRLPFPSKRPILAANLQLLQLTDPTLEHLPYISLSHHSEHLSFRK
jgi:hypothetical protein